MTDPQPTPAPAPEPQRQPVVVNTHDSDLLRNVHDAVTNLGNKLGALPESIVHSFREATNTPPAPTPQPTPQPTQQPTTASVDAVKEKESKHWASKYWFGK